MVPVGEPVLLQDPASLLWWCAVALICLQVALWLRRRRRASGKYETTMFTTLLFLWAARLTVVGLAFTWAVIGYQALRAWPSDQVTSQVWEYTGPVTVTGWSASRPQVETPDGVELPIKHLPGVVAPKGRSNVEAWSGRIVDLNVRCRAWHGWWPWRAEYVLAGCEAGPAPSTGISMIIEGGGSE